MVPGLFDAANRVAYSFNGLGELKQNTYDAVGNLVKSVSYANRISPSTAATASAIATALTAAGGADAARDLAIYSVFDSANRLQYGFNAAGEVTENVYDPSGNLSKSTRYGNRMSSIPGTVIAANLLRAARHQRSLPASRHHRRL